MPCPHKLEMQGIFRGIGLAVGGWLLGLYLQGFDGFRAGEPAVQELIGKVARLVLEGEPFRQRPHRQREAVHDPVMAEIPECNGQAPRCGGRHEFRGMHGLPKDGVAVMVPQVAAARVL